MSNDTSIPAAALEKIEELRPLIEAWVSIDIDDLHHAERNAAAAELTGYITAKGGLLPTVLLMAREVAAYVTETAGPERIAKKEIEGIVFASWADEWGQNQATTEVQRVLLDDETGMLLDVVAMTMRGDLAAQCLIGLRDAVWACRCKTLGVRLKPLR